MSIGDQPAFTNQDHGDLHAHPGMTYREWLIGQALAGCMANGMGYKYAADTAVQAAGAVIAKLDFAAMVHAKHVKSEEKG